MSDSHVAGAQPERDYYKEMLARSRPMDEVKEEEEQMRAQGIPIPRRRAHVLDLSSSLDHSHMVVVYSDEPAAAPDSPQSFAEEEDFDDDLGGLGVDRVEQERARPAAASNEAETSSNPLSDLEAYRTVTKAADGNGYVELRCNFCGANARTDSQFYNGLEGFQRHLQYVHTNTLTHTPVEVSRVAQVCAYRRLSKKEEEAMARGDTEAYSVPRIRCDATKVN